MQSSRELISWIVPVKFYFRFHEKLHHIKHIREMRGEKDTKSFRCISLYYCVVFVKHTRARGKLIYANIYRDRYIIYV